VRWLWEDRIPVGVLVLIGGREGVGKTIMIYTLAAQVTTGTLPGIYAGQPKAVIVAATEDSWTHTITPRLMAAGADLTKVFRADVIDATGVELPLSLPKDTSALLDAIREKDAVLVIFDPLLSRIDARLDTHKDADVRRALEPLAAMADTGQVSVCGLIHVNKSSSLDCLSLLMGSRAFTAVARAVLFVAADPDDEQQRLLSLVKSNLGRLDLPMLRFRIRGVLVGTTAEEGEVWTGQLVWAGESDQSIRDVLKRAADRESDPSAVQEAVAWLIDYLTEAGGTASRKTIMAAGHQAGHSRPTLDRARHVAGIKTESRGFPRTAYWSLPPSSQSTQSTQSTHAQEAGGGESTADPDGATASNAQPTRPPPSPERESTESTESTEPQLFRDSLTAERWRETDEAFRKGWKA
jgi:hypothetical protein